MRKLLMLAALLVPMASQAQFELGLRAGYAPAMGDAEKDGKMTDVVKSQIPLQLDAAYKVTKDISVGAYFAYGIAQLASDFCPSGADCSGSDIRLGLQGFYTFNQVKSPLVPWIGAGFGYEMGSLEASGGGAKVTVDYSGFEFLNLQAGGDYRVNEKFSVGPYLQFTLGQYSKVKFENNIIPAANFDGDIEEKAMHQWLGFGIRGKFDL
jgi:hypothetical protein